jgi:hypothetical protein
MIPNQKLKKLLEYARLLGISLSEETDEEKQVVLYTGLYQHSDGSIQDKSEDEVWMGAN